MWQREWSGYVLGEDNGGDAGLVATEGNRRAVPAEEGVRGAGDGIRTRDLLLGKEMLYP